MKVLIFFIVVLGVSFCSGDFTARYHHEGYQKVHVFKSKNGVVLGTAYVRFIKDDIFSSLIICHMSNDKIDTLYRIDSARFINAKQVIEEEVRKEGFWGYKMLLKKDDYIVFNLLSNDGKEISDNITIEWNYEYGKFELQKAP